MLLFCEELGFAGLHSKLFMFQERVSVVDGEVQQRIGGIEEQNPHQDRNHSFSQRTVGESQMIGLSLAK
jgi:hypothetical protein